MSDRYFQRAPADWPLWDDEPLLLSFLQHYADERGQTIDPTTLVIEDDPYPGFRRAIVNVIEALDMGR